MNEISIFFSIQERIAMSSLQGLPPLPRSLSGFNLSGGRSEGCEPPPPPTRSSSKTQRGGKISIQSSSRPSPPARQLTTLDTQLAILRREMVIENTENFLASSPNLYSLFPVPVLILFVHSYFLAASQCQVTFTTTDGKENCSLRRRAEKRHCSNISIIVRGDRFEWALLVMRVLVNCVCVCIRIHESAGKFHGFTSHSDAKFL